jgi:hypothetical protein
MRYSMPTSWPDRPAAMRRSEGVRTAAKPIGLATIAAARHRQQDARILRAEVCNRSDDGSPPLEHSERTDQILDSRDWLPPTSRQAEPFSLR